MNQDEKVICIWSKSAQIIWCAIKYVNKKIPKILHYIIVLNTYQQQARWHSADTLRPSLQWWWQYFLWLQLQTSNWNVKSKILDYINNIINVSQLFNVKPPKKHSISWHRKVEFISTLSSIFSKTKKFLFKILCISKIKK